MADATAPKEDMSPDKRDAASAEGQAAPSGDTSGPRDRTGPLFVGVAILLLVTVIAAALVLRACGADDVVVPDVSGMDSGAAGNALEANQLSVGVVTTETVTNLAPGVVVTQTPMPGVSVPANGTVDLVVSVKPDWVKTPEVIGLPIGDAEEILRAEGLEPLQYQGYDQDLPTGFVAGQVPEYNVPTLAGDPVVLYVSIGYRTGGVVVPELDRTSVEASVKSIEDAGLTPEVISLHTDRSNVGEIVGQVPAAGIRVPAGSKVAIVVLIGAEE